MDATPRTLPVTALAPRDGGTIQESARSLTASGLQASSTLVHSGSLVISTRAPIGYVVRTTVPLATNQGCKALVPQGTADTRWFQYVLMAGRATLQACGNGTTFMELSTSALGSIRLPAPPVEEQSRIADYLDVEVAAIDELVAEQRKLIGYLTERRASELDRWIEHGGDVSARRPVESTWVDAIPTGWELMPLKHAVQRVMVGIVITPSAYYADDGVPVLRGLNVRPGQVNPEDLVYMSDDSNLLHAKSILHRGDVVVVRTGMAGAAAEVPPWAVGGNAVDLLIVRPGRRMLPAYLEFLVNSRLVQRQVVYGSVGALQAHFNTSALSNVSVTVPPVEEQHRVVDHLREALDRYDMLIAEAENQVTLLRERRQALITHAVTHGIDGLPGVA